MKKPAKKSAKKLASKKTPGTKKGIRPLGERVLVRPFTEEEIAEKKKSFGIILPDSDNKEKSSQGKVLEVGDKVEGIRKGDRIVFSKYGYDEVEYEGDELYIIKLENILAVIS